MAGTSGRHEGRTVIREGADRYLLLVTMSLAIAVVGARWSLQATGDPQIGGSELTRRPSRTAP